MGPLESAQRSCANKWTVLVLACLQNFGGMSPMAIGVTAQDMKNSFNMTQKEYGIATSIYLLAELNTLPMGLILDILGPTFVTIFSVILTVIPHAALGIMSTYPPFDYNELMVYFLFLIGGVGLAANNAVIFWANMANFPSEQHGRIVGIINGVGFFGSMFFNVVYTKCLNPSLVGYFGMVCAITGVTFSLGIIFNIKVASLSSYEPIEFMHVKEDPKGKLNVVGFKDKIKPFWKSIQTFNLFLLSGISYGVVNAQLLWFSSLVESLGFSDNMAFILSISPFVSAAGLIVIGFLSDCLLERCPRMGFYCFLSVIMTMIFLFSIFYIDSLAMIVILTITNGLMIAAVNCLVLAELHKEYGEEAFSTTMGMFYLIGSSFIFISQYLASVFYSKELHHQGNSSNICFGEHCFDDFAIIQTCLMGLCVVLNICYIKRRKSTIEVTSTLK